MINTPANHKMIITDQIPYICILRVCVCVRASIICCVYALSVRCVWDFPELRFPAHVGVSQVVFCSLLHAFMLCELCHRMTVSVALLSDSSLSAYVFHDPSSYGVLFGFQLRLSPVSISPSSQQRNPTRTVCLFISCLFVQ